MSEIDIEENLNNTDSNCKNISNDFKWASRESSCTNNEINIEKALNHEMDLTQTKLSNNKEDWLNKQKSELSNPEKWSNQETDLVQINLGEKISEITKYSSFHGLSCVFRLKKGFKHYFWLACFLISLFFCSWLIIETFIQYFSYKVTTQVKLINEIPTEFPKITICNKNPLTSNYGYLVSSDIYQRLYGSSLDDKNDDTNLDELLSKLKMAVNKYSREEKQKWGSEFNEMILSCSFSQKTCDQSDFEWIYHSEYGNCFVFNSGRNTSDGKSVPIKRVHNTGSKYGLTLDLFVGIPESWEKFYETSGAILLISNNSIVSKKSNEVIVSAGVTTKIALKRTHLYKEPIPYSDCSFDPRNSVFDSPLYNSIIKAKYSYSQQDCLYQCLQKKIEDTCDCFNPEYIPLLKQYSCFENNNKTRETESVTCAENVTDSFFMSNIDECKLFCPLECNRVLYSYTSAISEGLNRKRVELQYLNNQVLVKTFGNVTYDKIKKSIVKLSVYYDDLVYTEITETVSMTIVNFIANIGGILAFFLGASCLSFLEIFEILHEILLYLFNRKKSNSKVTFKNFL